MLNRTFKLLLILTVLFFAGARPAFAHSVVSPANTDTSKYETFTLGVPSEKPMSTTEVRLVIPAWLESVTPFVKPGWTINVTKVGDKTTEIDWSGGAIPAEQKDIFQFTAATPAKNTTLIWKAYQTYEDGEVVAWDRDPKSGGTKTVENPYSTTEVRDIAKEQATATASPQKPSRDDIFSIVAVAISVLALSVGLSNSKLRKFKSKSS